MDLPEGIARTPEGWPFMAAAWVGCIEHALTVKEFRDEFTQDTGHSLESLVSASPIEKMIDESTGRTRAVMLAFCDWVTLNLWGEEEPVSASRK